MNRQIQLALIGAGNRGQGIFGKYALDMPHRAAFTAVVEPDRIKRDHFSAQHRIPESRRFTTYEDFFRAGLKDIEGVVIATLEDERIPPILKAMERSYHILVEKPLCTNAADLVRLHDATRDYPGILIVCHQMRLVPLFRTIKNLVDSGRYGDIVCVQHSENLSYSHMAHSYVRGVFNHSRLAPMLLAKSCHDMDFLSYLIGKKARRVASFGALTYFKKANCPAGAPPFCLEGCPHYHTCPYHVLKLYFEEDTDPAFLRQMGVVTSKDQLRELLMKNRYGKCVFQTDNDVVDHQTVQIEFEGDIHASFTMCGHNGVERRMTKISMTNGEIDYDGVSGDIKVHSFEPLFRESLVVNSRGTHGGGDRAIMDNFVGAIESGDRSILVTPIQKSFDGHLLVFAAEESRKSGTVIALRDYADGLRASPGK
jgi:predicted dehydrogenase